MKSSNLRKYASSLLKQLRKGNAELLPELKQNSLGLKDLDNFQKFINENQKNTKNLIEENISEKLDLNNILIQNVSMICVSLLKSQDNDFLFPKNWLHESEIPNVGIILGNLVGQLANYGQSISTLSVKGFDNQARSLVRIIGELSCIILVLIFDKDSLIKYCSSHTEDESNETWYKLFGKGKLSKKLSKIEELFGHDNDIINTFKDHRWELNGFYSQVIHNSFISINVGFFADSFNDGINRPALMGGASSSSRKTVDDCNFYLCYFLIIFYKLILEYHKFTPNPECQAWDESISLYHLSIKLFIELSDR